METIHNLVKDEVASAGKTKMDINGKWHYGKIELHRFIDKIAELQSCEKCQHYVESKTSKQFGHCLRVIMKPTVYNTVENDWYCKGIED